MLGGHTTWRYARRSVRWTVARSALSVLAAVLRDYSETPAPNPAAAREKKSFSEAGAASKGSAAGVFAAANMGTVRDGLLAAVLSDQTLQTALTTAATVLATSAFPRPGAERNNNGITSTGNAASDAAAAAEAASRSDLLPLDFHAGLLGRVRATQEQALVEVCAWV